MPEVVKQVNNKVFVAESTVGESREAITNYVAGANLKTKRSTKIAAPIKHGGNLFTADVMAFMAAKLSTRTEFRWRTKNNGWVTLTKDDVSALFEKSVDQTQKAFEEMEQAEIGNNK